MSFYIDKIKVPTPPLVTPPATMPGGEDISVVSPMPLPAEDEIRKARNLVKEQNMPSMMWKQFVLEIIDEHPEISQFISTYLGS